MALERKTKIIIAAVALVAILVVAGAAAVLTLPSASNTSSGTSSGTIRVVAAENFWGSLVSQSGDRMSRF